MVKQMGSILDMVNNVIKGVGTPTAADHAAPRGYVDTGLGGKANTSHTHPVGDLTATGTKDTTTFLRGDNTWNVPPGAGGGAPTGPAGGDLGSTYPNPTVVKSLANFAVGGNLTVGSGTGQVIIPISGGTSKGRLQSLPGIPNWIGYTLNAAFNGTAWDLDDTSVPGWFFKLDGRAASTEYSVWFIPAGANPHTDERLGFKVDSTGVMTVANRITGISAPSAPSDAIRHDDTRLSNTRTPTAHAASHGSGQGDAVTLAESQVTNLVTDLAGKAATVHTHAAADVTSGVVDVARLGTAPAATEYLKAAGATGSADWVSTATVKTDLALTKTDVGLANVPNLDTTNAANLSTGVVPQARLGASGSRDTTTYLRGDNTFAVPPAAGPAGGGLAGSYPNPTIATNAVSTAQIFIASVTGAKMAADVVASGETATGVTGTAPTTTPAMRALGTGANQAAAGSDTRLSPTGSITMFAGTAAPTGWFLCTGGAISRTTFAALFAVIGTTYGAGDGSTTFNVPDLQSRLPVGVGTHGAIGTNEGLATASEASRSARFDHRHTHAAPLHAHGNSTLALIDGGTHTHGAGTLVNSSTDLGQQTNTQVVAGGSLRLTTPAAHTHTISGSTNSTGAGHTHGGITGATANNAAADTDQQGVGGQDARVAEHPYLSLNFIIKA